MLRMLIIPPIDMRKSDATMVTGDGLAFAEYRRFAEHFFDSESGIMHSFYQNEINETTSINESDLDTSRASGISRTDLRDKEHQPTSSIPVNARPPR